MPVILEGEDSYHTWLHLENQEETELSTKVMNLLKPYEGNNVVADQVSSYVNSSKNQGTECIMSVREWEKKNGIQGFFIKKENGEAINSGEKSSVPSRTTQPIKQEKKGIKGFFMKQDPAHSVSIVKQEEKEVKTEKSGIVGEKRKVQAIKEEKKGIQAFFMKKECLETSQEENSREQNIKQEAKRQKLIH
eukprot:TRINITY_DN9815_c0_g1_i1.p1 TRINITY_DN9815_c0_g1~~TRINITY_DN9815_c0_g1_i1.p1  ORF type:complete len:191 (+),score=40.48 TRINITY_DN9815_c0_g1_i1:440-1012(+)